MKRIGFQIPKTFDWIIFIIPLILICTGIAVIYSLTYYNNAQIDMVYTQAISAAIGLVLMLFLTFVDYRSIKGISWILYLIGLFLLILVLFIGKSSFGAKRWIDLHFYDLQPSEFMKLFIIFIIASLYSDYIGKISYQRIIFSLVLIAIPTFLVLKQPDLGSASVLFATGFGMILFSKITKKQFFSLIIIILSILPLGWIFLKDYQRERIFTFLNPAADRFGSGYNVIQAMITVGSGGMFGKGFGNGPQSQLNFLPVAHTDFIFSGIAEATGFVGCAILIILYMILIYRIINVANIAKDYFGMLLAIGISIMFLFQVFVNIGMNIGIMPVTGIPLPMVSYGGSSLILNLAALGILQSIYLRHRKITF